MSPSNIRTAVACAAKARLRRSLEEDITVLIDTDESYTQPIGKNIRWALKDLMRSAVPRK